MLIGILGDIHSQLSKPIQRCDDFVGAFWNKMYFIFDTFIKNKVDIILQPGDFFNDYGNDSSSLIYQLIVFFKKYTMHLYCIYGQHDLRFHNTHLPDIPLNILNEIGLVHIIDNYLKLDENVNLYGASFECEIPKIKKKNEFNILMIHDMIIKNKELWNGQTHYSKAKKLLTDTGFDLIVSGDNHQGFIEKTEEQLLINCGSLTRLSINQISHQPRFYIYNTEDHTFERYDVPIEKGEDVFKIIEKIELEDRQDELEDFTSTLQLKFKKQFSFRNNLNKILRKSKVSKSIKNLIEDSFILPKGKNKNG